MVTTMNTTVKTILIFIFCSLILYGLFYFDIYNHEQVHKIIYSDYDINSTITISPFLYGNTIGYVDNNMSREDYNSMSEQHNFNEVIQYNTLTIKILLIFILMFIIYIFVYQIQLFKRQI